MSERESTGEDRDATADRYDSYCGLYCGACDTLMANEQGCAATLAREWKRTVAELQCHGCKSSVNAVFCRNCEMRRCARAKRIEFCHQCPDFPCAGLVAFRNDKHPYHSFVLKNLDDIRTTGPARWLEQQRQRWSCPNCGARCSWYDRKCVMCGAQLHNCEDEEKTLPSYPVRRQ